MAFDLPAELQAALARKTDGLSRNDLAQRAAAISENYRSGGNSGTIRTETEALAYALARMPATYAAVAASLKALMEISPDFAPRSLLDIGAGPATASWAAAEAFPSLTEFTAVDANPALRALAIELASDSRRLHDMRYERGEAVAILEEGASADLVIANYLVGEMNEGARARLAERMWGKTRGTLVIVEPGTPAGYRRMLALRTQLVEQGAHVAAPCPHDNTCPLAAPDWCHFTQRLPRSRDHKQVKNAELPYEDEKFAYVVLMREPVVEHRVRILSQPNVTKVAVTAKRCTPDGLEIATIPRRAKQEYARARRWRWGDAIIDFLSAP